MGCVNMQWESQAGQWQVCVPWRVRSWGWLVPMWGLSCEACALTLS